MLIARALGERWFIEARSDKEKNMPNKRDMLTPAFATLCLAFAATAASSADIFNLKSTTFEDGKIMPKRVANSGANQPNNPNCVGDNVSPEFSWSNPPEGTKSFVMMMFGPEGRARHSGVGDRICRGGDEQALQQLCRRQEHDGGGLLFRTVHAAEHHAASLYVHSHRY
jgi:hypothetical protein